MARDRWVEGKGKASGYGPGASFFGAGDAFAATRSRIRVYRVPPLHGSLTAGTVRHPYLYGA
jgi:hypothetical protein